MIWVCRYRPDDCADDVVLARSTVRNNIQSDSNVLFF